MLFTDALEGLDEEQKLQFMDMLSWEAPDPGEYFDDE